MEWDVKNCRQVKLWVVWVSMLSYMMEGVITRVRVCPVNMAWRSWSSRWSYVIRVEVGWARVCLFVRTAEALMIHHLVVVAVLHHVGGRS